MTVLGVEEWAIRCEFTYEQFATWKWEDVYQFHTKPHAKAWEEYQQNHGKTTFGLNYEPT